MAATATPNPTTVEVGDSSPNTGWKPELHEIPIEAIAVSGNVRANVDDIVSLIESVKTHGVISPIRVADIGAGQYELVYGQRRLAAAKAAGLATIPAIVDAEQPERADRAVDQLIENLQRADLNALDTATAYRWLLDEGMTQRQLGDAIGVAQPTIANTLALLKAPEEIQAKVASGELTRSHVEAIVRLPKAEQVEVARRAVEHKLSTRQIEEEVARAEQRATADDRRRDEVKALADAAEEALGKKKGATKEVTKLRVYDEELRAELKRRGWTTIERTAGYGKPKGCDCLAWDVSRNYMGSSQKTITLSPACTKKAHFEAAEKTAAAERAEASAKHEEERRAEEATERAEHDAAIQPVIDALLASAEMRGRVVLSALADYVYGFESDAFGEIAVDWPAIASLPLKDVEHWTVRLLADHALDDAAILVSLDPPKAKPVKASKVAKVAAAKAEGGGS